MSHPRNTTAEPRIRNPQSAVRNGLVRLQKFLADSGVASRRGAEQIILAGRVRVNGETVRELGTKVHPGSDQVVVDGQAVRRRRRLYIALNKPPGFLCTRRDPEQRRIIGDLLPKEWQHLYPVGRLDCESEGLIFLTNDGDFALRLTHPRYGTRKTYQVTVAERVEPAQLKQMTEGLRHEREVLRADRVRVLSANQTRTILELELSEGKNHEIRRLLSALGLTITRLQRNRIGPIKLGELPPGKWRTLTEPEINTLMPKL